VFSFCVIHKEGLCPSNGDFNRPMMMMIYFKIHEITNDGKDTEINPINKR
jgi:hypothetical protein